MKYRVITTFTDLQDNGYRYHTGDTFPRDGVEISTERVEELLTDKNRRRKPMIEEVVLRETSTVEAPKAPKKKGGKKKNVE